MGSTALLMQQSLQISSAPLTTPCRSSTDRDERRSGALRPYPVCGTVVCAGTVRFTDRAVLWPPIWQSPGGCFFCQRALESTQRESAGGVRTLAGTPLAWLALRSSGRLLCPIRGFGRAHRLPAATSPAFAIGLLAGSWLGPCTFPPARVRLTAARSLSARC